ncbi:hypothetical protein VW29_18315 [Devosia limi DSM 17137]|uniref:Uncharacterized protein n=1 Tax=Devosia limi DSM 17137 TaxID=1121477 RepID=A0A0F5L536_9HYPH|nr:hypothetical protein [Devosia limi]KKB77319.1 hypothetical protein VW29_18315 [Devosia limi DSM 17137]SHE65982.1 hypothetical protein SAMN02745223_00820 [Devosia limi DSM 17137]
MVTAYIVQSFQLRGRKLTPDQPKTAKTREACIALAERMGEYKAGVFAFSQDVDIETDTYDEPRVLLRLGSLPPGLPD